MHAARCVLIRGMSTPHCLLVLALTSLAACRPPGPTQPQPSPPGRACTMEAKMCPDGSAVGRTGPDCAFAACPGETTLPGMGADPAPPSSPNGDPEPVPM